MWKIEGIVRKGKYEYAIVRNHPSASKRGYVLHHRILIENSTGRLLQPNEIVHHKNGNGRDNRLENLQLLTTTEHRSLHAKGRTKFEMKCPHCGKAFFIKRSQFNLVGKSKQYTCCSPSCRGSFSRRIQLQGETPDIKKAISENFVQEHRLPSLYKDVTSAPEIITIYTRDLKKKPTRECLICKKNTSNKKYCSSTCALQAKRKQTNKPTFEQLCQDLQELSWCAIGRKYKVTDNAVRKWARNYGLLPNKRP